MKKITYQQQVLIGVVFIIIGHILASFLHKGFTVNIAWALYGLILILNPVCPERCSNYEKEAKLGTRIGGIICIIVGLLTRYVP